MHKLMYLERKFKQQQLLEQGSIEWKEARKWSFGGSEIYEILNSKPKKFKKLIDEKKNPTFCKKDITNWGHLFEPVVKKYVDEYLTTWVKLFNFGALTHPKFPITYSPDGLMIDSKNELKLIEIKCPIYKNLNENIAPNYLDQIQTGMNVFPVDGGIFLRFRFRRCFLWMATDTPDYDNFYHKEFNDRKSKMKPICWGHLYWETNEDLIDLATYNRMLDKIPENSVPEITINKKFTKDKGLVMMWKLFEYKIENIERDKHFLENKNEQLWEKYKQMEDMILEIN